MGVQSILDSASTAWRREWNSSIRATEELCRRSYLPKNTVTVLVFNFALGAIWGLITACSGIMPVATCALAFGAAAVIATVISVIAIVILKNVCKVESVHGAAYFLFSAVVITGSFLLVATVVALPLELIIVAAVLAAMFSTFLSHLLQGERGPLRYNLNYAPLII